MDLLKTAAMEFENLLQVTYYFEIARKNNKKEFILNFRPDLNDPPKMVHRSTQNRQTGNRQTEKGMLLNTNILNTKGLNTYNSSSSDQNETRRRFLLDEEEEQRLRERLKLKSIADRCSPNLVEAVFHELCWREYDFCRRMTDRAMEQVCLTIQEKQQSEPIRMLPNLINTYLDNIMMGIKAAGGGGGDGPAHQGAGGNLFNRFEQHKYDFSSLEKEILSN